MTGIGPVAVRCPRVRDRVGEGSERIRFSSAILPPYARRSKTLEVLIPILYLKGVSTATLRRRWSRCSAKMPAGCRRPPSDGSRRPGRRSMCAGASAIPAKHYVYFWADRSRCRRGSKTPPSACWSSSAPRRRARRS